MRTPSMNLRRVGLATMATSLVLGGSIATAGTAAAEADFDFTRIQGADRFETSAKTAAQFGTAETVILVSGQRGRYPDALTANYLAGLKDAPVLLTKLDETPTEVKKAMADLGAKNVIIVGGTGVVSEQQEKDLDGTYNVRRLAGADRFATASAVIAEGDEATTDTALLATGVDFADALGGGAVAFSEKMPLAITRPDDAPDNVVEELKKAGINKVLVLGGESVVSKAVVEELDKAGITLVERFAGKDRAETSALFAEYALKNFNLSDTAVNAASGYKKGDGADALGGAAFTGSQDRALLITNSNSAPGDGVLKFLGDHRDTLTEGIIFGAEGAVEKSVEYAMEKAVLGTGAQNAQTGELYDDVQEAIDAAEAGQTITVFGQNNPGFRVTKDDITIKGEDGASVSDAIVVQGVDGVTISGLSITPSNVGGQVAGIYLNDVNNAVISDNTVVGTNNGVGAGVINEIGGANEVVELTGNTFRDLQQGVYANPSADFTIDSNVFRNNAAGSANDVASVITNNRFLNNDEGIGLGGTDATVEGNEFANNSPDHVRDYTPQGTYDLEKMIEDNKFDEPVVVSQDGNAIQDES